MRPTTTSHELAGALIETAVERLELTARNLPGLRLPTTYAGHLVDSSSRCIQAWTLSALAEFGVDRIGGADIREAAGCGAAHGMIGPGSPWFERAQLAADVILSDLPEGVCGIHKLRTPMFYRGPANRLNLTFDLIAKLTATATGLRKGPDVDTTPSAPVFAPTDTFVRYGASGPAGIWGYRDKDLQFVLPAQSGFCIDYCPAPRSPGLFEIPTSGHPCFMPLIHGPEGEQRFPAGIPVDVDHRPGELTMTHSGWAAPSHPSGTGTPGRRRARYRVEGGAIHVEEDLVVDDPTIGEVVLLIPETSGCPLTVAAAGDGIEHLRIDTSGIAEWRSFWGEIPLVHQFRVPLHDGAAVFHWSAGPFRAPTRD